LDLKLVNDQLEILKINDALKCIKNVAAGNKILISFGLAFWAVNFVDY